MTKSLSRIWILLSRKLSAEATESEIEELNKLTVTNPETLPVIQAITESWENEEQTEQEFIDATYLLHLSKMEKLGFDTHEIYDDNSEDICLINTKREENSVTSRFKKYRLALFSTLSFAIVVAVFFTFNYHKSSPNNSPTASDNIHYTKKGNKTLLKLPDGTSVWLNADSKLDYGKNFGITLREIHLTGEAFFDVVKNTKVPFIVHTHTADIKVLGTTFNVKSYPSDKTTETSLIRGRVEVFSKNSNHKWTLKPNEKLIINNEDGSVQQNDNKNITVENQSQGVNSGIIKKLTYQLNDTIPVEIYWINNTLCFTNEPFSEVAQKMERWYDVQFEFRNNDRKKLVMYGTFRNETLQQALDGLQYSFGFKYTIENKNVIIY